MHLWLPSSSTALAQFVSMGGSPASSMRARVDRTTEATAWRALHLVAASLLWGFATDGPFEARNPVVALALTHELYAKHGLELLGRHRDELYELAVATAQGRVTEEDLAEKLRERARPLASPR